MSYFRPHVAIAEQPTSDVRRRTLMIIAAAPRAIPSLRVFHMAVNAECFEERSTMTVNDFCLP